MKSFRVLSRLLTGLTLILSAFIPFAADQAATSGCNSSVSPAGTYTVTICITNPANGSRLTGNATITATVSVVGATVGVQRMLFNLNTTYLLTDYSSPYTFTLPSNKWKDGNYTLYASALMRDGFTTAQSQIAVGFNNGNITAPVNNGQLYALHWKCSVRRPALRGGGCRGWRQRRDQFHKRGQPG